MSVAPGDMFMPCDKRSDRARPVVVISVGNGMAVVRSEARRSIVKSARLLNAKLYRRVTDAH